MDGLDPPGLAHNAKYAYMHAPVGAIRRLQQVNGSER